MLFFYSLSQMRKQSRLAARQQFLRCKTHTHTRRLSDTQAAKTGDDGIEAEDEDMPAVVAGQRENASLRSERNKSTRSGERREEARREELRMEQETVDIKWMQEALVLAAEAAEDEEVPVGALVVDSNGVVVGRGRNQVISKNDPGGHAELVALREAAQVLGNYRLEGCTLYVTLEPCAMCAGACVHARLNRLVYASSDVKSGVRVRVCVCVCVRVRV